MPRLTFKIIAVTVSSYTVPVPNHHCETLLAVSLDCRHVSIETGKAKVETMFRSRNATTRQFVDNVATLFSDLGTQSYAGTICHTHLYNYTLLLLT